MTKAEALAIVATAFMREMMREDDAPARLPKPEPPSDDDLPPQPRFDFDESNEPDVCIHGDLKIPRDVCPIHGPAMEEPVTDGELDGMTSEGEPEASGPIGRAQRARRQREAREKAERVHAEELPMSGMGPPPEDLPPTQ